MDPPPSASSTASPAAVSDHEFSSLSQRLTIRSAFRGIEPRTAMAEAAPEARLAAAKRRLAAAALLHDGS
jgi:hypothetical protein